MEKQVEGEVCPNREKIEGEIFVEQKQKMC